ncbi:MAG: carbohydrate kinase [Desulfosarcina sp.]
MIVVIGEILIDLFPDYQRIGGAPFNFAFHLKKLGFPVRLFTRVGADRHGQHILDTLEANDFDVTDVQVDPSHPTGTVLVDLDGHGVPQFTIRPEAAYDFLDLGGDRMMVSLDADMLYFGTLLQRTEFGCRQVSEFLSHSGASTLRFCDINMRPPHVNIQAVGRSLRFTDLLKLNEDERDLIQRHFEGPTDMEAWLPWLMETFNIRTVALTRGSMGSRVYHEAEAIEAPPIEGVSVVDTVGAGDGYAAFLAAGYLRRLPWGQTLRQATRFASQICSIPGAVPDSDQFYDEYDDLKWEGD